MSAQQQRVLELLYKKLLLAPVHGHICMGHGATAPMTCASQLCLLHELWGMGYGMGWMPSQKHTRASPILLQKLLWLFCVGKRRRVTEISPNGKDYYK